MGRAGEGAVTFIYIRGRTMGNAMVAPLLITFVGRWRWCGWFLRFCVVAGGKDPVPVMPDDVVEWLSAVCLLVCCYQHSVFESGGTVNVSSPTSKYIQLVNQTWQPSGLCLSVCICFGVSELLAGFPCVFK